MDEEQRSILSSRLAVAFGNETQPVTAKKLNTTQTNVSRWISGAGVPSVDMLYYIAR
jgi:transcriptional regulator with XRE-family HTH domain